MLKTPANYPFPSWTWWALVFMLAALGGQCLFLTLVHIHMNTEATGNHLHQYWGLAHDTLCAGILEPILRSTFGGLAMLYGGLVVLHHKQTLKTKTTLIKKHLGNSQTAQTAVRNQALKICFDGLIAAAPGIGITTAILSSAGDSWLAIATAIGALVTIMATACLMVLMAAQFKNFCEHSCSVGALALSRLKHWQAKHAMGDWDRLPVNEQKRITENTAKAGIFLSAGMRKAAARDYDRKRLQAIAEERSFEKTTAACTHTGHQPRRL